jgi:hypothetical protein
MFGLSGAEFAAAERCAERALAAADVHMTAAEVSLAAAQRRRSIAPLAAGGACAPRFALGGSTRSPALLLPASARRASRSSDVTC